MEQFRNSLPENVRALFDKKYASLQKEIQTDSPGWTVGFEKRDIKIFTKKDPVYIIQKSDSAISLDIEKVVPYLKDPDFRKKYDNLFETYDLIKKLTEDCILIRAQIKGKFMIVSARDFVTYVVTGWLDDDVALSN